jgi:purine-binding chemotaxis protein CheW
MEPKRTLDEESGEPQLAKFLTFVLGRETYALDIRHVREIIGMQKITTVPDVPSFIKGVINLRGKVIPVMDVRSRFRLPLRDYDDRTCIIVIHVRDWSVGLVVDTVSEVLDIPAHQIEPPPRVGGSATARFLDGMGKVGEQVRLVLNAEELLGASTGEMTP